MTSRHCWVKRAILTSEAQPAFPQYVPRIANTVTTQCVLEYIVHKKQQEEGEEENREETPQEPPPQEQPSQADAGRLKKQAIIDAALKEGKLRFEPAFKRASLYDPIIITEAINKSRVENFNWRSACGSSTLG